MMCGSFERGYPFKNCRILIIGKEFRKVKCGTRADLAAGHACCEDKDKKGLEKQNEKADFKSTYSIADNIGIDRRHGSLWQKGKSADVRRNLYGWL